MKLPEPMFAVINPIMRTLLRSPLHPIVSRSLMLITFTGTKSGRQFTTPVRYLVTDDTVRCFTATENKWWRNLKSSAEVDLLIHGTKGRYNAQAVHDDPVKIRQWLEFYLDKFPQDAAYHDIRLNKDKTLVPEDLERAVKHAVVVEATPV